MKYVQILFLTLFLLAAISCKNGNTTKDASTILGNKPTYSTYNSFEELVAAEDVKYVETIRITSPGTKENPTDHGFWFYNCMQNELHQFDPSGRYMVAMQVSIEGRDVLPNDRGVIGIIDLQENNKWTEIGRTTAWNWQQGNRLQWVPGSSEEIIWNDRADDGKSFVSRIHNTRTKATRTLPRAIYTISPDGKTALTHDFSRMKHGGTNYVGIKDEYEGKWAPEGVKIWKMDLQSGMSDPIISIAQVASLMYPPGTPVDSSGTLYFFREGFNPSGNRFIFFVKDAKEGRRARTEGYSASLDGSDIRYFYKEPSHHFWLDDENIMDNGWHTPPGAQDSVRGYFHFKDNGSGKPTSMYFEAPNGHITISKDGNWILTIRIT